MKDIIKGGRSIRAMTRGRISCQKPKKTDLGLLLNLNRTIPGDKAIFFSHNLKEAERLDSLGFC